MTRARIFFDDADGCVVIERPQGEDAPQAETRLWVRPDGGYVRYGGPTGSQVIADLRSGATLWVASRGDLLTWARRERRRENAGRGVL